MNGWRAIIATLWLAAICGLAHAAADVSPNAPVGDARVEAIIDDSHRQPVQTIVRMQSLVDQLDHDSNAQAEALVGLAKLLTEQQRFDEAEQVARRLDAAAQARGARFGTVYAAVVRARVASLRGMPDVAFNHGTHALAGMSADFPIRTRTRHALQMAYIFLQRGQLDRSLELSHEAYELAPRTQSAWLEAQSLSGLSDVYAQIGQITRARELAQRAIRLIEQKHPDDDVALCFLYNNSAQTLSDDINAQSIAYEKTVYHARRTGSSQQLAIALGNLAMVRTQTNQPLAAIALAEQALSISRAIKEASVEIDALYVLGTANVQLGHLNTGKRYFTLARAMAASNHLDQWVAGNELEMGSTLERAGDLAGATEALYEHRRAYDVIQRENAKRALVLMQERYDAQSREAQLAQLQQENVRKAAQLQARRLLQHAVIAAAGVGALSLASIGWLLSRLRNANHLLRRTNASLRKQGERDPLTGLGNRRHLESRQDAFITNGAVHATLCLLDIDHFKLVNDRYGHTTGDAVLIEVSRRLRRRVRGDDLLVRWGGEEVLVVWRSASGADAAARVEHLLDSLRSKPVRHGDLEIPITASAGFASFPLAGTTASSLDDAVRVIDAALYLAKTRGRNRAVGVAEVLASQASSAPDPWTDLACATQSGRVRLIDVADPTDALA